jgi:hypothetical protein
MAKSNVIHVKEENVIPRMIKEISGNLEKLERDINHICMQHERMELIFDRVPEQKEIWNGIKKIAESRDDFAIFIRAMYIFMLETTVDEDLNDKYKTGKPKRIYNFPKEFIKPNTETRHFLEIIDTLGHTFDNTLAPSKLKLQKEKLSYPDALEELLGSNIEPQSLAEFQYLQLEVLIRFENAMKILLEILKKHKNNLKYMYY